MAREQFLLHRQRMLRDDGNAVIGLLADGGDVVAEVLNFEPREAVIRAFDLLHQHDIGVSRLQPGGDVGDMGLDGVDVERGNAHRGPQNRKARRSGPSYLTPVRPVDQPTANDVPQPQVEVALGFFTWKYEPTSSSTKSTSPPRISSNDVVSTTTFTPSRSNRTSSSSRVSSRLNPY